MDEKHLKKKQRTSDYQEELLGSTETEFKDVLLSPHKEKVHIEHVQVKNQSVQEISSLQKDEHKTEAANIHGESKVAELEETGQEKDTNVKNNAASEKTFTNDPLSNWPWIRLVDNKGREYYYNALTSKTSWTCTSSPSESEKETSKPPTAYSAAQAQKVWQNFWKRCREAQACSDEMISLNNGENTLQEASSTSRGDISQSMAIYVEHYRSPTAAELRRGARQQVRPPNLEAVGYVQGYDEYNIWYGKYLSDRREGGRREDREKATTRCNPFTDSGWTRCDMEPPLDRPVICLYFAKGCCYLGSNCRYYHRLPTVEDDKKLDMLHDIFGRERFAAHRDDMDGVGTFSEDCRTLFVGDMKVNRVYSNAEEKTEELLRQQFGLWGPIESIRVIRNKNIAFVRYKYRVHAEFAKVAMAEQRLLLDRSDDQISVRWAHPGRDTQNKDEREEITANAWEQANSAVMKRLETLGYSQDDINCQLRWSIQHLNQTRSDSIKDSTYSVISTYPDTQPCLINGHQDQALDKAFTAAEGSYLEESGESESLDVTCPRLSEALSRIETFRSEDAFKVII